MRTVRCSGRLLGGVSFQVGVRLEGCLLCGVSAQSGLCAQDGGVCPVGGVSAQGVSARGVSAPVHAGIHTPNPREQNDRCLWKYNLSANRLQTVTRGSNGLTYSCLNAFTVQTTFKTKSKRNVGKTMSRNLSRQIFTSERLIKRTHISFSAKSHNLSGSKIHTPQLSIPNELG